MLFNIKNEHLHDATGRTRILAACHGQGEIDGLPITWQCAGRKLWSRAGLDEDEFEAAWAEAKEAAFHDAATLRHYSRSSDATKHLKICEHALGLLGRTNFKEDELRDYFLKAVGDDVLCLSKKQNFIVWNQEQWVEDSGCILAHELMTLVQSLFQRNKGVCGTRSFRSSCARAGATVTRPRSSVVRSSQSARLPIRTATKRTRTCSR